MSKYQGRLVVAAAWAAALYFGAICLYPQSFTVAIGMLVFVCVGLPLYMNHLKQTRDKDKK